MNSSDLEMTLSEIPSSYPYITFPYFKLESSNIPYWFFSNYTCYNRPSPLTTPSAHDPNTSSLYSCIYISDPNCHKVYQLIAHSLMHSLDYALTDSLTHSLTLSFDHSITAAYSTVTQSRASLPDVVGALTWIAPYAPHHSSFVPVYASAPVTPSSMNTGTQCTYKKNIMYNKKIPLWAFSYFLYHFQKEMKA